jgi:cysteinyl-tRNA synthetase
MTFDIVRRVLEDYFGYNVTYVMNVTDVDDKIILRARRNYLVEQFLKEDHEAAELVKICTTASFKAEQEQVSSPCCRFTIHEETPDLKPTRWL